MDKYFNLTPNLPLSKACITKGHKTFNAIFDFIKQLSYGRTSNRSDYTLVLKEGKGTCSTKHALLKAVALENGVTDLELYLGIFKMNAENTPNIKSVLEQYDLAYIPEAHCYLKLDQNIIDLTFPTNGQPSFVDSLVHEETIHPEQIGRYKVKYHQDYLKLWIKFEKLSYSFDEIWSIREACIRNISA